MKKITKLLLTYLCTGTFLFGMSTTAKAFEDTVATNDNVMIDTSITQDIRDDQETDVISLEANDSELVYEIPLEDGYEVYTDEQGQVIYIEKTALENELVKVEESKEVAKESETKKESKETKKTTDSKKESSESKKATTEKKQNTEAKKATTDKKQNTEAKKATTDKKQNTETKKATYSKKDLRLLASLVYAEAGDQSYEGMLAVANVVLNRVESSSYSHVNSIKEVIFDKKWSVQFAVIVKSKKTGLSPLDKALELYDTGKYPGRDSEVEMKAMKKAIKAAKAALEGESNIGNYLCFNSIGSGTSRIKSKYSNYKIIGSHIFYRTK